MRARSSIGLLACGFLLACSAARAEPIGSHVEFTQFGGYTLFSNDRNALTGAPLKDALYLGGRIGYLWKPFLGIEAAGGYTPTQEDIANGDDLDFWHVSGNLMVVPFRGSWGWPYLSAGGGVSELKRSSTSGGDEQGNAELAGGLQLWLNDVIGVRLEARDLMWLPKDDVTNPRSNDLVVGAGLTFAIGAKPRDSDGDGVPDKHDTCPNTPAGARVSATGCPLDTDSDGVYDGLDRCEGTPPGAKVDTHGCPFDADSDGVFDGLDQCPNTPRGARVDIKGCPLDSDGDGVVDGIDQCDSTARGCKVDAKGCPIDSDNDGVCDGLDQCPDTSPNLKVDANGCPIEVSERETELLDTGMMRMSDIQFESGKADLKPQYEAALDVIGQVLMKWPELKIEIGGHTDSRGSAASNQKLSESRVKTVLEYLLKKFPTLRPEQYTIRGYGESRPVVPNVSPEAMARNRRVEFVVQNREVLKREIERRKLLEKTPGK